LGNEIDPEVRAYCLPGVLLARGLANVPVTVLFASKYSL